MALRPEERMAPKRTIPYGIVLRKERTSAMRSKWGIRLARSGEDLDRRLYPAGVRDLIFTLGLPLVLW